MEHPPEQPAALLAPGFEVGPWRVEAWLGQGAYGAVFRAVHPWDGRMARPDAKGQCPLPRHVSFNGFCWVEQVPMTAEECVRSGHTIHKGKCYGPVLELPQKTTPTSGPGKAR